MRFQVWGIAVVAALVLSLAAVADAQQPGGRGRGGFGGFGGGFGTTSRLQLLAIEAVQKELDLAADQVSAIEKVREELRPMGRGRGGQPGQPGQRGKGKGNDTKAQLDIPSDWYFVQQPQRGRGQLTDEQRAELRAQAEQRAKDEKEKLGKILLPNQVKRLNELYIQRNGTRALDDADVSKDLEITAEQKEKIGKVREEMQTSMRDLFQPGGDQQAAQAKIAELRKSTDEKILAVLTDGQRKKFEEMKGKPFTFPEVATGGRGGRGGNTTPRPNNNNNN